MRIIVILICIMILIYVTRFCVVTVFLGPEIAKTATSMAYGRCRSLEVKGMSPAA